MENVVIIKRKLNEDGAATTTKRQFSVSVFRVDSRERESQKLLWWI